MDFIVPGEMELTSAVRSVSSSNKCNGTIASAAKPNAILGHCKDKDGCGSGNDGDDEDDFPGQCKKQNALYVKNSPFPGAAPPGNFYCGIHSETGLMCLASKNRA